jgi:hypothetical protein
MDVIQGYLVPQAYARLLSGIPTIEVDQKGWIERLSDGLPANEFKVRIGMDLAGLIDDIRSVLAIVDDQKALRK